MGHTSISIPDIYTYIYIYTHTHLTFDIYLYIYIYIPITYSYYRYIICPSFRGLNCPDQCCPGSPLCIHGLAGHRRLAQRVSTRRKNAWNSPFFYGTTHMEYHWTHASFFGERYGKHRRNCSEEMARRGFNPWNSWFKNVKASWS